MGEQLTNRKRVLCASETTYGTDAVNAILTDGDLDIIYQDVNVCDVINTREIYSPPRQRGSDSGVAHVSFADRSTVELTIPMTGKRASGAGNETPYYDPILTALKLQKTVVSDTSATYRPATAQQAAMTIYEFRRNSDTDDWRLEYATGVRGSGTIALATNTEALMTFSGVGLYTGLESDEAEWFDPSDGTIQYLKDGSTAVTARVGGSEADGFKTPLKCQGITLTYNSVAMPVSSVEIDLNWNTVATTTVNGSGTVTHVRSTRADGERIMGSFDLEDTAAAFEIVRDALANDTEAALSASFAGGGDAITIAAPKMQVGMYSPGANAELRTHTVPFMLAGDWGTSMAADNDLTIAYT